MGFSIFQAWLHIYHLPDTQKINPSHLGRVATQLNLEVKFPKNSWVLWKSVQKLSLQIVPFWCFLAFIPQALRKNAVVCTKNTCLYTDTCICWIDESTNCRLFFLISLLQWMYFGFCLVCGGVSLFVGFQKKNNGRHVLVMILFLHLHEHISSIQGSVFLTFLLGKRPHWEKTHWKVHCSNTRWSCENKSLPFGQRVCRRHKTCACCPQLPPSVAQDFRFFETLHCMISLHSFYQGRLEAG